MQTQHKPPNVASGVSWTNPISRFDFFDCRSFHDIEMFHHYPRGQLRHGGNLELVGLRGAGRPWRYYGPRENTAVETGEAGSPGVRNPFSAVLGNRQTAQEIAVSAIRSLDDHKLECTDSSGCEARNPGGSLQRGRNLSTA